MVSSTKSNPPKSMVISSDAISFSVANALDDAVIRLIVEFPHYSVAPVMSSLRYCHTFTPFKRATANLPTSIFLPFYPVFVGRRNVGKSRLSVRRKYAGDHWQ